jgi:hypothetical protein
MAWTQPGAPAGSYPVAPVEVSLGRWFFGVAARRQSDIGS